ncbi:MAG: DUF4424 family protein [candidate division WOR-3 bacterium]|nr:MAG: DUF4424 family protein [candidate division WOR-3 bacterium]
MKSHDFQNHVIKIFVHRLMLFQLLFLILCITCQKEKGPPIDFFKEDITIEIEEGRLRVTGIYFFKNLTSNRIRVNFYYPFPVDVNHHYPDTIAMSRSYEENSSGINFTMLFNPKDIASFHIMYEQRISKNQCTYITTTTRKWERPIKEAHFTIIIPDTLSAIISYPLSHSAKINNKHHHYITIQSFFPKEDLMIEWTRNSQHNNLEPDCIRKSSS